MTAQPAERAPRMREVFRFGFYAWNINLAEDIVQGREPDHIRVDEAGPLFFVRIDEAYAATVDLTKPLILAPFADCGNLVIDGWHRIWKARRDGVETLPAHLLTPEEEYRVRIYGGDKGQGYYR
ncbi:hypothetical protein ACQP1V_43070 (plasmid) [Microtetraspora malaysiensis]|uniref:hypothetical protein n=1 Tax=Microtetraspora malaysiensis TaxID=161358 RepID=UPI003D8BF21C